MRPPAIMCRRHSVTAFSKSNTLLLFEGVQDGVYGVPLIALGLRQMFLEEAERFFREQLRGNERPPTRSFGFYEIVLALAYHEDGAGRALNHFFSDAAAEPMRQTAFAVSRHDN